MSAKVLVQINHPTAGKDPLRLSTENFAATAYWAGDIISIDPVAYRMDHLYGGMVKISGGNIVIALSAFDSVDWWPPEISYQCSIYLKESIDTTSVLLMEGTLYRKNIDIPLSVSFDFYPKDDSVNLLETATDYNGDDVVLPKAFGNVVYVVPVRLPDSALGARRYSAGSLTGTKHTDWHVHDDGVDVCSNATAITSNVFEYNVTPVGELTISGAGVSSENWEIFDELCGAGWLNITLMDEGWESGTISRWQDTQIFVLDFLSEVAAVTDAYFYILGGTLYLHDMDQTHDYYTPVAYDVRTELLKGTKYDRAAPKSIARYEYKVRTAVEETIGKYVKETDQKLIVLTPWSYGEELSIDSMMPDVNLGTAALWNALIYHVGTRFYAALPMTATAFKPGTKITLTDDRFTGKTVTVIGNVRDILYDFVNKTVNLEGSTTSFLST